LRFNRFPEQVAPKIPLWGFVLMNGRKLIPGKAVPPSEIPDYSINHTDNSEVFSAQFLRRLEALNRRVADSKETMEGNIFYWDREDDFEGRPPAANLASARRNLWRATRFKRQFLEIGFNAGHSALLALSSNPSLTYHGVDIGVHSYTVPCVDFLKQEFPGRVHFWPGDSREVLPYLATRRGDLDFDIFHVDGGHTDELCRADVANCLRLARGGRGKHLLLDDINASWIFDIYCEFVSRGKLATETFFDDWEDDNRNVLGRIL
jgi:hypothetical protein